MDKYIKLIDICEANDCFNEEHDCDNCIFNKIPTADVQPVNKFMSDICIVCGRDVRKDTEYYDINGATVCDGCMSVKCKVEKEG